MTSFWRAAIVGALVAVERLVVLLRPGKATKADPPMRMIAATASIIPHLLSLLPAFGRPGGRAMGSEGVSVRTLPAKSGCSAESNRAAGQGLHCLWL